MENMNQDSNKIDEDSVGLTTEVPKSEDVPMQQENQSMDCEMPSTSTSSTTTTNNSNNNDEDDASKSPDSILQALPEPGLRKKRFSSRNYRNHTGINAVDSSSSDDSEDEVMQVAGVTGRAKRPKKYENSQNQRAACPPPPEYLEEIASTRENDADNEANSGDMDETVNSDLSSSSSSSSSEMDETMDENATSTDAEDEDVSFLNVERPRCTWVALRELYYREHGLSGNGRRSMAGRDPQMFKTRVTGSLNSVERLELMSKLERHDGCVNGLNFSQDGRLLASGSDDLNVVLWNWASGTVARCFRSGHQYNVFQTKFYGNGTCTQLITTARDGLVRNHVVPSSGGKPHSKTLYKHVGSVHRVAVGQKHPFDIVTAGEDSIVMSMDLREEKPNKLLSVKADKRKVVLYGVCVPQYYDEFCVYGRDKLVRIYDRRNTNSTLKTFCPDDLSNKKTISVTCAVYNHLGNELLASYADDDIYLFNRNDQNGAFEQRYRGHWNSQTIKGVNFFGSGSEFIVSGSDCGNIFFWDKKTTKIVQWMRGDENGAINVLEPHPEFPFLATSGIDSDVKIWVPSNEKPPDLSGLEKCVKRNMRMRSKPSDDLFDEDFLRLIMQRRLRSLRSVVNNTRGYVLASDLQGYSDAEDQDGARPDSDASSDEDAQASLDQPFPCSPM